MDVAIVSCLSNDMLPSDAIALASYLQLYEIGACVYPKSAPDSDWLILEADIASYNNAINYAIAASGNVVLYGDYITICPQDAMGCPKIEYGVIGDPETPCAELISGQDPTKIAGLCYGNGTLIVNPKSDLPRRNFAVTNYRLWRGEIGGVVNYKTTRHKFLRGGAWRPRGISGRKTNDKVKRELMQLRTLGVVGVMVEDRDFAGGFGGADGIIAELDRLEFWECNVSIRSLIRGKLDFGKTKCRTVFLDILTVNDRLADEYGVYGGVEVDRYIDLLLSSGTNVVPVVTIGLPGETIQSLKDTNDWLVAKGLGATVRTFTPMPGTVFYENHGAFNKFGFEVIGTNSTDFIVHDDRPISFVPWQMSTIQTRDFLEIRNEMVAEFNCD